jgi:hypothetical protein
MWWKSALVAGFMVALGACAQPPVNGMVGRFDLRQVADTAADGRLQAAVQRADEEQARALSQRDPNLMRDTSTDDYYQQLLRTNQGLVAGGVTAIELLKIEWGPSVVQGPTAQLAAFETWRTIYADGTVEEARDRNMYTLVNQGGAWKIQSDTHPDNDRSEVGAPAGDQGTSLGGGASSGRANPDGRRPRPERETPPARGPQPERSGQPGRGTPAGPGQSRNWSGYAASGGPYTAVSGTWTVPWSDPAGAFGSNAAWVGIGGVESRDLIQAGTDVTVDGNGHAQYQAWVEDLPRPPRPVPLTVKPGDSVTVSLNEQSPSVWRIAFKNNTSGQTFNTTQQYNSSHSSAEWVEEAPSGTRQVLPLNEFGSVAFTGGSAIKDGQNVSIAAAGAEPVTMIDGAGQPIAVPSSLGPDGASFRVTQRAT